MNVWLPWQNLHLKELVLLSFFLSWFLLVLSLSMLLLCWFCMNHISSPFNISARSMVTYIEYLGTFTSLAFSSDTSGDWLFFFIWYLQSTVNFFFLMYILCTATFKVQIHHFFHIAVSNYKNFPLRRVLCNFVQILHFFNN